MRFGRFGPVWRLAYESPTFHINISQGRIAPGGLPIPNAKMLMALTKAQVFRVNRSSDRLYFFHITPLEKPPGGLVDNDDLRFRGQTGGKHYLLSGYLSH